MNDQPGEDEATVRILRAALVCFAAAGTRRTTMNEVADRAGVGVATVYRRFPRKKDLVLAAMLHDAQALTAEVDEAIDPNDDLAAQICDGFTAFTRGLARRPMLRQVIDADPDLAMFVGGAAGHGEAIRLAGDYLAGLLRRAQDAGEIPDVDADVSAEIFARLATSLVLSPKGAIPLDDEEATRAFARRHLLPLVGLSLPSRSRG